MLAPAASAAPDQQTWYLTADNKPGGAPTADDDKTHAKDNLLHKGGATATGHHFDLPYDEVAWFYADTGAECPLGFGEGTWKAYIRVEGIEEDEVGHTLKVEICRVTSVVGVSPTVLAEGSKTFSTSVEGNIWEIICLDKGDTDQDFGDGDWLAIRVSWTCSTDKLRIYYGIPGVAEYSYIQSPPSDPGYPTPNLPGIILLSTGLVALLSVAGVKGIRRRRSPDRRVIESV